MSNLVINDLAESKALDKAASMKICGGEFNQYQFVARELSKARAPSGLINIITNNFNNTINENPTFFNVYNGDGNSGTILNNFNTFSLTAASPAMIVPNDGSI
jgi:hypothetical protein